MIEVLLTLVLLGVMGTIVFSGLSAGVREYGVVRQTIRNAEQLTLARVRLHKEFSSMSHIIALNPQSLQFQTPDSIVHEISFAQDTLFIEGQPLLRGVKGSFSRPDPPEMAGIRMTLDLHGVACQLELYPINLPLQ